ncbi:MAG: peptidase M14 [Bryobacteraceae bacterium]|nr:peptidase M14 [Bryobacteraceae bacterium]
MRIARAGLVSLLTLVPAVPQTKFEFWPSVTYDPSIPTHRRTLGYDAGERITSHEGILQYLDALAAAAPGRMRVFEYGRTWEDRRLVYAVIGSEANLRRLEEIRTGIKKLADPRRTPRAEAEKLIASLPATVWLAYGVHGNEISSPDAALLTAYHLLAARNDKLAASVLADVLVFIDPLQNPDGRTRFLHHFIESLGPEPDPNPDSLEHTEPWPGGRTNHYHFDMNRDWFALTQPETRGRVKALLEWLPLVFVDLHEMGSEATYYFAPEAVPYNPHIARDQRDALEWFGRNNARWFDQFGFSYFTREIFDAFYPGYGASWPSYYGSVAMTYEQASSRGLAIMRRTDSRVFHFRETVRQHFLASIATCETAALRHRELLSNFYKYRQSAIDEGGKGPVRAYILPRRGDVPAVDKLAHLLAGQGIEVKRTAAPFDAGGKPAPAGSYIIDMAQPAARLVRTLLDPDVKMEEEFVKEQERLRSKNLPDEIYDIVAWSLPLLYNVELIPADQLPAAASEIVAPGAAPPAPAPIGRAKLAYLVPWGTAPAGRFLAAALREGLKVWTTDKEFEQNGRTFPRGTLILRVSENEPRIHDLMPKLAAAAGADAVATDSGWVDRGVSFGSNRVVALSRPAVAIAWDRPVAGNAAGHTRFVLERQFGYPVTPIRTHLLAATADLSRLDVLILPDGGNYASVLGEEGLKRLNAWVESGGALIGVEGALTYLADPKVGLLAIARENQPRAGAAKEKPEKTETPPPPGSAPGQFLEKEDDYRKAIEPEHERPDQIPGVLARARVDEDHWITAGLAGTVNVTVRGRSIFTPIKLDKGVNAATFLGPSELLAGGYLWEENRRQLAYKPFVIVQRSGRGVVIGFTADPNFRAYMDGLNALFLNAVFRSQPRVRATAE